MEWVQIGLYLIGIWGTLFVLDRVFHLKRFNIEVSLLTVMYKTRRINQFITWLGSRNRWFWRAFWTLGSAIGIIIMGYAFYFMGNSFLGLLFQSSSAQPIAPILPGINVRVSTLPYILFAMLVSLSVHELSHGIAAVAEKVPIKSAGLFLFILFPGGFVELDQTQIMQRSPKSRLRIFSAGIFANLITGVIVLGLVLSTPLLLSSFYTEEQSLMVTEVEFGTASSGAVIPYSIIYSINGVEMNNYSQFITYMQGVLSNQTLILETSAGEVTLIAGVHPENSTRGYLGILSTTVFYSPRAEFAFLSPAYPHILSTMLLWLFIVSFSLGVLNLLPLPFFDGDHVLGSLLEQYMPRHTIKIGKNTYSTRNGIRQIARFIAILLLVGSMGLTILRFGTLPIF